MLPLCTRPHLILGKDKSLIALSNGASPDADKNEMCLTLVQPIRPTADDPGQRPSARL